MILAIVLGMFLGVFILQLGIIFFERLYHQSFSYHPFTLMMTNALGLSGGIIAYCLVYRRVFGVDFKLKITLPEKRDLLCSVLTLLGALLVSGPLTDWFLDLGETFREQRLQYDSIVRIFHRDIFSFVLGTLVFAPVLEEILFRGIVLGGMLKQGENPRRAILISALVFGLIHGNLPQFLGGAIIGMILGYAYYKTHNLVICIAMHIVNNSLGVYSSYQNTPIDSFSQYTDNLLGISIMGTLLLASGYFIWNKNEAFSKRK